MRTRIIAMIATVILGGSAYGIAATVLATPAWAAGARLCESFGPFCAGSDDLNLYSYVLEKDTGRNLDWIPDGGTEEFGYPSGVLKFTGADNRCLASTNDGDATNIKHCSNDNGIIWGRENDGNGHFYYHNRYVWNTYHFHVVLSGSGVRGSILELWSKSSCPEGSACYQRWNF